MDDSSFDRPVVRVKGSVATQVVNRGTGSEHDAVVLLTDTGERLTLVRLAGNPFNDSATRSLVGKLVEVVGYRMGQEFRYTEVREI